MPGILNFPKHLKKIEGFKKMPKFKKNSEKFEEKMEWFKKKKKDNGGKFEEKKISNFKRKAILGQNLLQVILKNSEKEK